MEVVEAENEGVGLKNKAVENDVLPPERKWYNLSNIPTINYNDGRSNWRSIGWSNLIVGSHAPHNITKDYVKNFNSIATFVEPTPPTNIIPD